MRDGQPTLALVGSAETIGSLVQLLPLRRDLWGQIRLVDVDARAGAPLMLADEELALHPLAGDVFDGVDVAIFDVDEPTTARWVPAAVEQGAVVVDNSPTFRMDPDVPLVVATINPAQVRNRPRDVVASPSSTSLAMLDTVTALHSSWGLSELVVSTYHAASGWGEIGTDQLYAELEAIAGDRTLGLVTANVRARLGDVTADSPFPAPLALNVIPWVGGEGDGASSSVELAVRGEIRRVIDLPELRVSVTSVQVPVVVGHSLSVHATFEREVTVGAARQTLVQAPGVVLLDDPGRGEWPTPVDVVGSDPTFVGRLRQCPDFRRSLQMFISGDNLRKGNALNSLQIAELVIDGG